MPDSEIKSKLKRKLKTNSKADKNANKVSRPKKMKPNSDDGIAKSKQLAQKLQTCKSNSSRMFKSRSSDNEVRLCGNGIPMPSLADLEKLYEDSDSDEEPVEKLENKPLLSSTPKPCPEAAEQKLLMSPKTIEKISKRMLDLVSNLTEPPILLDDDDGPPPAVIKPKKKIKSGVPYIVGCKKRPYVPSKANNKFCVGEDEYGVDKKNGQDDDDDIPKKRAKRSTRVNLSKSVFNAMSDEIAARLKEQGDTSDASSDSNKTVAYIPYTRPKGRSFSPLPSTSKDNETFLKNDDLFNESLISVNASPVMNDDIEIIEPPCDTILINDTPSVNKSAIITDPSIIELTEDSITCDDSVQVVNVKPTSPISVEDYYSSCNLDTEPSYSNDACEIIDVDDLIAQNNAIIQKYTKRDNLNTITSVDISKPTVTVDAGTSEVNISNENIPVNQVTPTKHSTSNVTISPSTRNESGSAPRNLTNTEDHVIKILENNLHRLQSILDTMPNKSTLLEKALNNLQSPHKKHKKSRMLARQCGGYLSAQHCVANEDTVQIVAQTSGTSSAVSPDHPEASKKLGDCPICMDTLSNKTVASTMCGHIFCMNCIKLSIKLNGRKCPTCRKALRGVGYHQIFL